MPRVHRVCDIAGKQTWYSSGSRYCSTTDLWACASQSREHRTKSSWGTVYVDYVRYPNRVRRLDSEMAYWG